MNNTVKVSVDHFAALLYLHELVCSSTAAAEPLSSVASDLDILLILALATESIMNLTCRTVRVDYVCAVSVVCVCL